MFVGVLRLVTAVTDSRSQIQSIAANAFGMQRVMAVFVHAMVVLVTSRQRLDFLALSNGFGRWGC